MKKLLFIPVIFFAGELPACPSCNPEIRSGISSSITPNLPVMLSAFIVIAILVGILTGMSLKKYPDKQMNSPVPLGAASLILGIGLGGFADGIILHQILQWHEMLSNQLAPDNYVNKSINMFWDGIFHAFCLLVVITGVVLLWKLLRRDHIDRSGRLLGGGLLAGWGIFNIVEGIIDHQILKIHNVKELSANHDVANYAFLGVSALLLLIGFLIMHQKRRSIKVQ